MRQGFGKQGYPDFTIADLINQFSLTIGCLYFFPFRKCLKRLRYEICFSGFNLRFQSVYELAGVAFQVVAVQRAGGFLKMPDLSDGFRLRAGFAVICSELIGDLT
jgi:hypothetical protein